MIFLLLSSCVFFVSCNLLENDAEEDLLCQQMLLYVREGLKDNRIDKIFKVYVLEQSEDGVWTAYLDDGKNFAEEKIYYNFDKEKNWYEIQKSEEPIFSPLALEAIIIEDDEKENIKNKAIYRTELSADTILPYSIRYTGPSGPFVLNECKNIWNEDMYDEPYIQSWIYVFNNERTNGRIIIEYPLVSQYSDGMTKELNNKINENIRKAFFLDSSEENLNSVCLSNCDIKRNYKITNKNENILSMRINEYNYSYNANHPNSYETGLTINLNTGEPLELKDIIKGETPIAELLRTGNFKCKWTWEGEDDSEYIDRMTEVYLKCGQKVNDFNRINFYITENGLGLIMFEGRYCTCIEADFETLKDFIEEQKP